MATRDRESAKRHRKTWYESHKQQRIAETAALRQLRREQMREYKSKLSCILCSEVHPACLDFHHVDPSTKLIEVSKAVHLCWSWERIMAEVNKCIVLCKNCHAKQHYEDTH
jgi:hypothetical protein